MKRMFPSGTGLPPEWAKEHDQFICYCEALGNITPRQMIAALKKRFECLQKSTLSEKTIEARIACLELMDNDYFKEGAERAVARMEAAGYVLPPMDLEQYSKANVEASNAQEAAAPDVAGTHMADIGSDKGKSPAAWPPKGQVRSKTVDSLLQDQSKPFGDMSRPKPPNLSINTGFANNYGSDTGGNAGPSSSHAS
ncbi:MAG: hypothetical protein Q9190_007681, partial [Brigantiaea leucoxantha]